MQTTYICEQVFKINRIPISILNLLILYCCSGPWYLGSIHLLLVGPAGSHLAFRQAFLNQFNHRHFQSRIWSKTEIIFPGHCIYTIFLGLVSCELWHLSRPLQSTFPELYFNIRWFPFMNNRRKSSPNSSLFLLYHSSLVPDQLRVGSFQPQTSLSG